MTQALTNNLSYKQIDDRDVFMLIGTVREGIKYGLFQHIADKSPFPPAHATSYRHAAQHRPGWLRRNPLPMRWLRRKPLPDALVAPQCAPPTRWLRRNPLPTRGLPRNPDRPSTGLPTRFQTAAEALTSPGAGRSLATCLAHNMLWST